jgi:small subunit ribosomal protein S6
VREYELTVVFDLSVAETGGNDAAPDLVTTFVEARKGTVLKHDHWGRRRMAYPINRAIDADYVVSRVEIDPEAVTPLEAALRIDERVYRHLIVRADELPIPPPPREPRRIPAEAAPEGAAAAEAAPAAEPAEAPGSAVVEAEAAAVVAEEAPAVVAPSPESLQTGIEDAVEAEEAAAEEPAPEDSAVVEPALAEVDEQEPETVAAAVESAATEADAATEAGTEDEAPSA